MLLYTEKYHHEDADVAKPVYRYAYKTQINTELVVIKY